ncbi:hypothetical protein POM88_006088 [Heracleum sosnowskyi]|uniref:FAS1 domain-containing protein n=1 Tax=Heracleum sosnowskyi TaxID=360622 RepID=A0AAD8MZP6_9APIA|nr:hypothetical protein POM88_006088 [Heracleum sosnowskyi]
MKSQLYVTITIVAFGFASITCVSSAGYNVYVINALKSKEPMGVSCGEIDKGAVYKPQGPPQVTLQVGERHVWHLDKLPAKDFSCLLSRKGLKAWTYVDTRFPDQPNRYFLAIIDAVYQDTKDLPPDDPGWDKDSQNEYDAEGTAVTKRGFDRNIWLPPKQWNLRQHHQRKLVPKNRIEWPRIIHLLRSKGYASFAMGLNSVIEGIIQDFKDLDSATILAPPDLPFLASASPLLQRIVKFHMLPRRFSFTELTSLPEMASLRTLLDHKDLQITTSSCFSQIVAINGVEIASPDISASNKFVIHGISEVFPMEDEELSSVLG